uniref:Secreted protein n=1 Tax=Phakopsora pachyrhizi TaxID=170000 RepID=A0A0S1MJ79_PHAPC
MFNKSAFAVTIFSLLCLTNFYKVTVASISETQVCSYYSDSYGNKSTCNEQPNVVCTGGCHGPYVVANNCMLQDGTASGTSITYNTTQVCTKGFGRNTAAAKACLNEIGPFTCTGPTNGAAVCYGCKSNTIQDP